MSKDIGSHTYSHTRIFQKRRHGFPDGVKDVPLIKSLRRSQSSKPLTYSVATVAPYALGGRLIGAGAGSAGILVILYGIMRDWRFWLVAVMAFVIGFWSA